MNIAIDISPLTTGHYLQHRVRGTGFYLKNLRLSLAKYYPNHAYLYFQRGKSLPSDIDIVHYPYFEPFFLTLPLRKKFRSVVTVHDLTPLVFPKHFPPGIKGRIKWQIQKRSLKRMDAIIADSESSKKDIVKYAGIPDAKVHVVYLAAGEEFEEIDKRKAKTAIHDKYGLPDSFVLYVGDATWNKNLPRLIKAIKKIDIPLVMTGKTLVDTDIDIHNPWNKDLVEVQRLVKDDTRIMRLGFVPTDDLVSLYNAATVFAMPSLYEGFGLPILEAMRCGCPVITSREGSLPEIGHEGVYYVDPYNVEDIARGVKEVYSNQKLRTALSKKGRLASEKFTWKKTVEAVTDVYDAVFSA